MYESPIEMIYGELQTQMVQEDENMVMKAVRKVGVNVDKEELIKALQYERNQYTKGYSDGYTDGKLDTLDKLRAEIENHCGLARENSCKASIYCSYCNSVMRVREILEIIDKWRTNDKTTRQYDVGDRYSLW